jgi:hypothetical protein
MAMQALHTALRVLSGVLALMALAAPIAAGADKGSRLGVALSELESVRTVIDERIASAEGKRGELEARRNQLKAEIMLEGRRLDAALPRQALQHKRIEYDLRLVQQITAYIDQLDRRIVYFRSAIETLDFYGRQIRDEMSYLKTVSEVDISRLSDQIKSAVAEFSEQAGRPLLGMSELSFSSLENIWNEMTGQYAPAAAVGRSKAVSAR